ncbi:RT RNaseH 2 domain-containing protein [Aphis craccivora]|uniref:RT RNaseH 2 domain-containing protein n=1 Tax=Aphis craccivora TaxID=307492 RepID=A0A6G0VKZ9_APHCR|nr:RT RNaseH 2 domain-containing protein [Aphis craccivora]
MNKPTNEDDVTGTEASETSDPAVVSELVTSVVINSSDNVSWNSELEKFDISESNIISMQAKLSYIKEFFQNDMYWPMSKITGKHNQVTDHNRDKMIQVIDEITNKILFLDKCKVKTGTHLEPAKEKLDKAIKDLDILAVEGLSKKRRFIIYDLSREIKASLETARLTLNEHMHE